MRRTDARSKRNRIRRETQEEGSMFLQSSHLLFGNMLAQDDGAVFSRNFLHSASHHVVFRRIRYAPPKTTKTYTFSGTLLPYRKSFLHVTRVYSQTILTVYTPAVHPRPREAVMIPHGKAVFFFENSNKGSRKMPHERHSRGEFRCKGRYLVYASHAT